MQSLNVRTKTSKGTQTSSRFSVSHVFKRDYDHYEGVPRINIYLLRLLFTLMFLFVAYGAWSHIANHNGPWNPVEAAAWCVWATYSTISFIGILRPLRMLPIVLFEIVYKLAWLVVVAYPLWVKGELMGSSAEGMTQDFLWVLLPIIAMPWRYFFRNYLLGKRMAGFIRK